MRQSNLDGVASRLTSLFCVSVCSLITSKSLDVESLFSVCKYILRGCQVRLVYAGR